MKRLLHLVTGFFFVTAIGGGFTCGGRFDARYGELCDSLCPWLDGGTADGGSVAGGASSAGGGGAAGGAVASGGGVSVGGGFSAAGGVASGGGASAGGFNASGGVTSGGGASVGGGFNASGGVASGGGASTGGGAGSTLDAGCLGAGTICTSGQCCSDLICEGGGQPVCRDLRGSIDGGGGGAGGGSAGGGEPVAGARSVCSRTSGNRA